VIGGAGAVPVIEAAARRPEAAVRAGAAAAVRNLDARLAEGLATRLLADPDVGVRKVTVQSVGRLRSPAIDERLRAIQRADPEPMLREQAGRVLLQR
jgi:HEAT repeat protein